VLAVNRSSRRESRLVAVRRLSAALCVALFALLGPVASAGAEGGALRVLGCVSETGDTGACVDARAVNGAQALALSPDGSHVYVASVQSNSVASFVRDAGTGGLTQLDGEAGCVSAIADEPTCAAGRALSVPDGVALSPDGGHVYVTSFGSRAVAVFSRDATTGALTQLAAADGCLSSAGGDPGCTPARALAGAAAVAVSPDGANAYVASFASDAVAVLSRDPATGALSQPAGQAGCVNLTGDEGCAPGTRMDGLVALALSPDGEHLYAAARYSRSVIVYDRDPANGSLTRLTSTDGCVAQAAGAGCEQANGLLGPNAVTVSPDGRHVYVGSFVDDDPGDGALAVFMRDPVTGRLTQLPGEQGCISDSGSGACGQAVALEGAFDVAVSPAGGNVYLAAFNANAVSIFSRDVQTGTLAQLQGIEGCHSVDGTGGLCQRHAFLAGAHQVVLSPDAEFAYVPAKLADAVSIFETWEGPTGGGGGTVPPPAPPPGGAPSGPATQAPPPAGAPGAPVTPTSPGSRPPARARLLSFGKPRFDRRGRLRVTLRSHTREALRVRVVLKVRGRRGRRAARWAVDRRIATGGRVTIVIPRAAARVRRSRHGRGIRSVRIDARALVDARVFARRNARARLPRKR
jgi:DNA-binding beta-propeller fold protein YncE